MLPPTKQSRTYLLEYDSYPELMIYIQPFSKPPVLMEGKAAMHQLPLSPPYEPTPPPKLVPLDSPIRATPIHELIPDIRIPSDSSLPTYRYHPVTCSPIEPDAVRAEIEQLHKEYTSPGAALKAQEQAARDVKQKLEDAERKREDVQKAMDKKIKERNTELKVLSKYQEGKTPNITT